MLDKKILQIALILAIIFGGSSLTSCGSSSDENANPGGGGGPGGPGGPGGFAPGACVPITNGATPAIPFNGIHILYKSLEIVGGSIPVSSFAPSIYAGQSFGQMTVGGGGPGPYNGNGPDGTVSVNIMPELMNGPYASTQQTANINGLLTLSPTAQSEIIASFGGYQPYQWGPTNTYCSPYYPCNGSPTPPPPVQTNVCASGIAIQSGLAGYSLTDTNVYLYLNSTNRGIALKFYAP